MSRKYGAKGERFERDVARWFQKQGYRTELTPRTNDRGIDVIVQKDRKTYAVQAKAYSSENRVGSPTVQKASGLLTLPDIDGAIVISTSSFTSEAKEVANNRGVKLISIDAQSKSHTTQHKKTRPTGWSKPRTKCPTCGEQIQGKKQAHINHWKDCDLPKERPSYIPVDVWWEIKDGVR